MSRVAAFSVCIALMLACVHALSLDELRQVYHGLSLEGAKVVQAALLKKAEIDAMHNVSYASLGAPIVPFECPAIPPSDSIPTSVDRLRPSDIKVVMAVGDSLTAGFGANSGSLLTLKTEYRGVSWSIGGDKTASELITIPNILRAGYNADIKGFSTGTGVETTANANLNQAITGAVASEVPAQVEVLISRLKADTTINFEEDWKMLTIFIGGNDLCRMCQNADLTPEGYEASILKTLELVATIPRVFVSLVPFLDVTLLRPLSTGLCSVIHGQVCPCAVSSDATVVASVSAAAQEYRTRITALAALPQFNTDSMAVVIQPFWTNTVLPLTDAGKPDTSYFAPDCFHFSEKAHQCSAVALFNNLVEKVGTKDVSWDGPKESIKCPEGPDYFLPTNRN